jgi:hypothetical protein
VELVLFLLQVGDLVFVKKGERVPADLILLWTSEKDGSCFLRTDQVWIFSHLIRLTIAVKILTDTVQFYARISVRKSQICTIVLAFSPFTVNIRNPDRLVFEWSFFGHNLCSVFQCKMAAKTFENQTKIVRFSNGPPSLDRFIQKKFFMYKTI